MKNENQLVNYEDLNLSSDSPAINEKQISLLLKRTPEKYIKERPAKGGGYWKYVSGGYVKKVLNLMFGFDWSFEIMEQLIIHDEAIVKGKLTINSGGKTIVKMQFGNKDIVYKKLQQGETERKPLSIGNDLKAAATDALKKCAAEIGIAADIYNAEEFREIIVQTNNDELEDLQELYEMKKEVLTIDEQKFAIRIIENKETKSFANLRKLLMQK